MSIFKTRNKKIDSSVKMTGVVLEESSSSYLSLYITAKEVTKSGVARKIIGDWVLKMSNTKRYKRKDLIRQIIKICQTRIQELKEDSQIPFDLVFFKRSIKAELIVRGLSDEDIDEIINNI